MILALLLACAGGGDDSAALPGAAKPPLLPFPSAHLVGADGHLALDPAAFPAAEGGTAFPGERLAWRSGFSVVQTTVIDPEQALDAATVPGMDPQAQATAVQLWDLDEGVRWPALAELDAWCPTHPDDEACAAEVPLLLVRPLRPLTPGHRVAVVTTGDLHTAAGEAWDGPAWYQDLRAGHPGEGLEAWVDHYADLDATLAGLGVDARFAVDFPVGDGSAPLRAMAAQTEVPAAWTFTEVFDADAGDALPARTWKRLEGTFTTAGWLEDDRAFALADGQPQAQGPVEARLYVHLPESLRTAAPGSAPVWVFGHGIFSRPEDYLGDPEDGSGMVELADRAGAIVVATVWRGLTYTDLPTAITVGNDFGRIPELTDKLAQGVANALALRRLVAEGGLLDDPLLEGRGDPDTVRYHGISLGGIEGAVLLAVDPGLPHGVLHVGGSTWSTMLERSSNWPTFETLVSAGVGSPRDRQLLYAASQLFWDVADPASYVGDLQGRSVLWQESLGDEQVPNLTTESLARGVGATLLQPAVEAVPGLDAAAAPLAGPALAQFDPLLGRPPEQNRPAEVSGAHGAPRLWEGTMQQTLRFLDPADPGVVAHFCGEAPCTADNTGE